MLVEKVELFGQYRWSNTLNLGFVYFGNLVYVELFWMVIRRLLALKYLHIHFKNFLEILAHGSF